MKNFRRHNWKWATLFGLAMALILSAGIAAAQGPGQGKGMGKAAHGRFGQGDSPGRGHRLEMMAQRLDLNEDQVGTIKEIHEQSQAQVLELRKELMRLKNDLRGEMLKDDPSRKTVLSLNEKMGELKTELKANRLKTRLAVREQLTPQQRDKMLLMGEGPGGPGRDKDRHFPHRRSGRGSGGQFGPRDGSGPRDQIDSPVDDQ